MSVKCAKMEHITDSEEKCLDRIVRANDTLGLSLNVKKTNY